MSPGFIVMVILLVIGQLALPVRIAFLPLVIAGLHLGNVEILPELTPGRLLVIIGLGRAMAGGFAVWPTTKSKLDVLFMLFSFFALFSSLGHQSNQWVPSPFNARAGLVVNAFGTYLYARAYFPDISAFRRYAFILPIALIPLGLFMTLEQRAQKNYYALLGSKSETSMVRDGKVRAAGPFRHPILAGTAGATAVPFAYLMWRLGRRKAALIGFGSCMGVVLASASSGPLAAVAVAFAAAGFWHWRQHLRKVVWGGIFLALLYNLVQGRGPWYIMASMDLVGGSTGWHRAKLMDQGFVYLNEWWFWGTDYTRHWMASGMRWNPNHVDLTNYYLHLGVLGGLPLTLCVVGLLIVAFKMLTKRMTEMRSMSDPNEIVLWSAAASLAAHAISFVSISYFDQMYIYFYLLLGIIPGLVTTPSSLVTPSVHSSGDSQPIQAKPLRYYS